MNLSDRIRFSELSDLVDRAESVDDVKILLRELLLRLDLYVQDSTLSLRREPTIFTVNPALNSEAVEGAKAGDFAVFIDEHGSAEVDVLQ